MKSKFSPIGDLIRLVDNRNVNCNIELLLGINIKKEFIPSVANTSQTDLSKYKIIKKNQFCYSPMQTGRDETIRVSLYDKSPNAIISPAYSVFEVVDTSVVLPEFIMMYFLRAESDRYGWFISDGSVRASLDWERFCEITIPLPTVDVQKKYVKIYEELKTIQRSHEESLESLKIICDTFIDDLIVCENKKILGKYIQQIQTRNLGSANKNVLGISVKKEFIPSRANRDDLNVANYKLIKNKQFGYVSVTSRNGDKVSIAMLNGPDGVISSTYVAFEVIDTSILLPEYLYLWFSRSEFDRYARFHSWGSARETFDWDDMCNVRLPIPSIEKQQAIVEIHKVLEKRKVTSKLLSSEIKNLCPILIQGVKKELAKEF